MPELHSSEEMSLQWRAIGDILSNLTGLGIEPHTAAPIALGLATELTGRLCNILLYAFNGQHQMPNLMEEIFYIL